MKADQFNEIFAEVFQKSSDVLVKKAGEYADDSDRLHNFNVAALLRKQTPRQALAGFMLKHTVSIYDLVDVQGCPSLDIWDEKIVDHINYLILLRAVVIEELEGNGQDIPMGDKTADRRYIYSCEKLQSVMLEAGQNVRNRPTKE